VANSVEQLEAFLDGKRGRHGDVFKNALHEAIRYLQFLEIIRARVESTEKEYIYLVEAFISGKLTNKEQSLLHRQTHLTLLVQLEIESFYLFSKIYLDTTARFLEVYFGQHPNFRFESFEKLFRREAAIWKSDYGLKFDSEFCEVIQKLLVKIVGFRGKKIVHPKGRDAQSLIGRRLHALAWKSDGSSGVSLTAGFTGVKSSNEFYQSTDVGDLWKLIEQYTNLFIQFADQNVEKLKLRLEQ
jgi:hypothetical protein